MFVCHACTAILIRCCMKTPRLTSSVKKFPSYTVAFWDAGLPGLTFDLILLSLVSPGKQMKKRGIGNLSCMMYYASATGVSSRSFKLA